MEVMHNFALSEEQEMILDQVRKLVADQVGPAALDLDEHRRFARDNLTQLGELGLLGLSAAEGSGGAGLGVLSLAVAAEELAKTCGSTARLLVEQAALCGNLLDGVPAARPTCEAIVSGERMAAFLGPWCGVRATAAGNGWQLPGRAPLVVGGAEADILLVWATAADGPLVALVDGARAKRTALPALGFRAAAPAAIAVDGVTVDAAAVLVRGAEAQAALQRATTAAHIASGALAVGLAHASIEAARRHANERIAFGKPLSAQQAVRHKLVEATRASEVARHAVFHAARLFDQGAAAGDAAAIARLTAVDAAVFAADEAVQIHGGFGYTVEYHVERHYRDAQTLAVLDGGAEALRDQLAARMVS